MIPATTARRTGKAVATPPPKRLEFDAPVMLKFVGDAVQVWQPACPATARSIRAHGTPIRVRRYRAAARRVSEASSRPSPPSSRQPCACVVVPGFLNGADSYKVRPARAKSCQGRTWPRCRRQLVPELVVVSPSSSKHVQMSVAYSEAPGGWIDWPVLLLADWETTLLLFYQSTPPKLPTTFWDKQLLELKWPSLQLAASLVIPFLGRSGRRGG